MIGWREEQSLREFREAERAREREEEDRRMAPIRKAEETFKKNHVALVAIQRENISKGLPDDDLYLSPEMRDAKMSMTDAARFNREQAEQFAGLPEYQSYRTDANGKAIASYLEKNGVQIADAETFRAAFARLRDIGILTAHEEPVTEQVIEQVEPEPVQEQPTGPRTRTGRDYLTGLAKEFTEREINRMSADEYKRAFPVLPTMAEFFTVLKRERM